MNLRHWGISQPTNRFQKFKPNELRSGLATVAGAFHALVVQQPTPSDAVVYIYAFQHIHRAMGVLGLNINEEYVLLVPQNTDLISAKTSSNIALEWEDLAIDLDVTLYPLGFASEIYNFDDFNKSDINGINLFGGQKQLICLLRSLYREPGILFLDEDTSALDNSSDSQTNEILQSEKRNRAVIVIAHGMSSIIVVDEITFMESGFIKSKGTLEQIRSEVDLFDELINLSMDI